MIYLIPVDWHHFEERIGFEAENRNDRGSVALIVMGIMLAVGLVSFIVHDAARDQKIKTVQILQPGREIDPNESTK